MRLITLDLDDTLMWCGADYTEAKQQFGEYTAARCGVSVEDAISVLDKFERENVKEHGLAMDRFPQSFEAAYSYLSDAPTEDELQTVYDIGMSVFKSEEEYSERGFMDGAEQVLQELSSHDFDMHLITAGDPRIQQRKIDGLGLEQYFDDTHIVPIDTKEDTIRMLLNETGYGPSEAYHVGNSLQSDVRAALEVGANAVYLPTHQWRDVQNPEYYRSHDRVTVYDSITQLVDDTPDYFLSSPLT